MLLSAGADGNVVLWNLNIDKNPVEMFKHPDIVASVAFKPNHENYFISGCFDKILRLWSVKQRKVIEWS